MTDQREKVCRVVQIALDKINPKILKMVSLMWRPHKSPHFPSGFSQAPSQDSTNKT